MGSLAAATGVVGAASALACGAACAAQCYASSDAAIEAAIMANIISVEPAAPPAGTSTSNQHLVTIILLPGFTGSAEHLVPWFQRMSLFGVNLKSVRLVATTPPERNITCYDGWRANAWFDYIDEQFDVEDIIDVSQLAQSRRALTRIVDAEVVRLGGDASKVLLLGFSQGGNVGYDLALSYPQQLGGFIARRTSLREETALGQHKALPILHYHGEEDDGIGVSRGKHSVARLQAAGYSKVELHLEPGLNHTDFSDKEMKAYAAFLGAIYPHLLKA